ncbi:hypothetical protein SJI00_03545 [Pseudomonas sp. RP23018S]|uniref:hypothetical protein n=1 Tax=Pseudomonas sp. RP23018S TaxID=3096037 RepID=UPI002ACA0CB7|nr:hypothetical protein [Pseudomonas sp. RP23018S]MDZ5601851.1 hypothetical protein [Pseudomonas sp. RP23018S]
MTAPRKMFTALGLSLLILSFGCLVAGTGGLRLYGYPIAGMVAMTASATVVLYLLIEMRASRIAKGLTIIGFGAFVPVWSTVVFHDAGLGEVASATLEVLSVMFNLSAAGAGGSIIAAYGDRFSTDNDVATASLQITSDTRRILELERASRDQASWTKCLCLLMVVLTVVVCVSLVYR